MNEEYRDPTAALRHDEFSSSLSVTERKVKEIQSNRKRESRELIGQGRTLEDLVIHFDNDYTLLDTLYKEKTGVSLISDPYEASEHPIPITKTCSIVITSYNSGQQLLNSLRAIQASSFNSKYPQQLEVVVVDDGSPLVNIAELVEQANISDLNIKVVRQSNGRESKVRYSGVLHSKGDVVMITDHDVVYTPTMVEEYMKRHQVLDDVMCFGFENEVDTSDPRLTADAIGKGSLGQFDYNFHWDMRIAEEGMQDCDWLKQSGNNKGLPINTGGDWSWKVHNIGWGKSLSAPREALLRNMCAWDERYKGYGSDDENLIAELIADGIFVLPNTGGLVLHQRHPNRRDPEKEMINKTAWLDNFHSPPRRQNPYDPKPTDAQVVLERRNSRVASTEAKGIPSAEPYQRAKTLMYMGKYDEALETFNSTESSHENDAWFLHDKANTLLAIGGEDNVQAAINYLKKSLSMSGGEPWIHVTLAAAYGRIGDYRHCLESYKAAASLDPQNEFIKLLDLDNGNPYDRASFLHNYAAKQYLNRGKARSALRYYEAALALVGEEGTPWSVFDKGKALFQLGHTREAVREIERSIALMPHETWPYSQLALIYESLGNRTKARELFKKALELYRHNEEAIAGIERINKSEDIGLMDWKEFKKQRSPTLERDKNAKLDENHEITDYLNHLTKQYTLELEAMDDRIGRSMSENCRIVFTVPARSEGDGINKLLTFLGEQKDKHGRPINPDLFEIVIVDNHRQKDGKDNTEDEVRSFMKRHPQIRISYAHKVWQPNEPACVGNARKYAADLALIRAERRKKKNGDLVLVSFDADVDGVSENYVEDMIKYFDEHPEKDAVTGKWDIPEEALEKPNLFAAERLWYMMDRVISHDAAGKVDERSKRAPKMIGRNAAFRASIYAAVGGYNPEARLAEDLEMQWMINEARGWDQNRVGFINSAEVITNPRRYLAAMIQDTPLYCMYTGFAEQLAIRKMDNQELLAHVPDTFNIARFERDADAIWQARNHEYDYLGNRFEELFSRAMELVGAKYVIENGHIRIINAPELTVNIQTRVKKLKKAA